MLRVKDIVFKAHRAVLIARSSVFAAMFQHETSEKHSNIITISDCDMMSFGEFLKFLYCGEMEELFFYNAFHLYQTSDKYDVQELKTFCVKSLADNLTKETFFDVLIIADMHGDATLLGILQDFFNENLNDICDSCAWESLMKSNYRLACRLLKSMPKMKIAK